MEEWEKNHRAQEVILTQEMPQDLEIKRMSLF